MAYSTIDKPSSYFDTKLYTGTGATQSISGLNFSPDLVWLKSRGEAQDHYLFDSIRTATKALSSNLDLAEQTYSDSLTSFNSDGFTLGASTRVNKNTFNHVGWCWDANGSGSSNNSGTITSTVSANTTSGFSIVSFTGNGSSGATIGHGLGVAPAFTLVKNRSLGGRNWQGFHKSLGNTKSHLINSTEVPRTGSIFWNNTSPTSTLITLGNDSDVNESGQTFIAYCFADVKGFSKFGSYSANGTLDNAFVYTGFKPAMVIIKRSDSANAWTIFDNKRDPYNEVITHMAPNNTIADDTNTTYNDLDFLSNGFKIREDNEEVGISGATYIYMCFAENPFVSSKGIPCTAR